ncbi:MAG: DHH family phosphoesterase [Patescibacteria group bacterium]|jgi:phosphoesterase RecJ-like protein|nr:DHH family phosphoesterase [Patescibacteria group bacterium]
MKNQIKKLESLIEKANDILIIQPDNPDGDSLGSALALEQIFNNLGKDTKLYCGTTIPAYLKYAKGWSRVSNNFPNQFDLAFIVDTSSFSLLQKLTKEDISKLNSKDVIVLDHHQVDSDLPFTHLMINQPLSSTGELIYLIAKELDLKLNLEASKMLTISILSDSLGLTTEQTTPQTIRIFGDLVENGVQPFELDKLRKEYNQKSLEITKFKGILLSRIQTYLDNKIALIIIPYDEIKKYSPEYNPSILVLDDMRLINGNIISIALKIYEDHKITAKIRTNYGYPIANIVAQEFGGGGHRYAAGFKTYDYSDLNLLINDLTTKIKHIIENLDAKNL